MNNAHIYVMKTKIKSQVRDIHIALKNDPYTTLLYSLERQQNKLLAKIKRGNRMEEKSINFPFLQFS